MIQQGALARAVDGIAEGGIRGGAGQGGRGGSRGLGEPDGFTGTGGENGGFDGESGRGTLFRGSGRLDFADSTFVVRSDRKTVAEFGILTDRQVTFAIERLGDNAVASSVDWKLVRGAGIDRTDFEGPLPRGATLDFAAGEAVKLVTLTLRHNGAIEGPETFAVKLVATRADTAVGFDARARITVNDAEIAGTAGPDLLIGTEGWDVLLGRNGRDELRGGKGDDMLVGGRGSDLMIGGAGNDTFVYNSMADSGPGRATRDIIRGYEMNDGFGNGDVIDLSGIDADPTQAGDQAFQRLFFGSFSLPGQVRIDERGGDTLILLNTDFDADAEASILVRGVTGFSPFVDLVL